MSFETMDLRAMNRIVEEETLGIPPTIKDTADESEFRASVRKDIEQIRAEGRDVQLPNEPVSRG